MNSVRLLPVLIFAGLALLLFKGIGLVTQGGYVLPGPARASESASHDAPAADAAHGGEATMTDTSPTLADTSPTLSTADAHGGDPHAEAAPADDHGPAPDAHGAPEEAHGATDAHGAPNDGGHTDAAGADPACATLTDHPAETSGDDGHGGAEAIENATVSCPEVPDAVPVEIDGGGYTVPLANADGSSLTESAVLERLSERRAELDKRDADLALRESLIAAAEKKIEERTAALAAIEARINAMVEEGKAKEDDRFAALVGMYEAMKPKEAAAIFDALDIGVLLRVARAVNPRKMAPIMAKMQPARAQELTVLLASNDAEPKVEVTVPDVASLPQITPE